MRYTVKPTRMFRKDLKIIQKRGYDLSLITKVIKDLAEKYKDHALIGNYKNCRECHITPDWILIYEKSKDEIFLYLTRTGTHSDLFR